MGAGAASHPVLPREPTIADVLSVILVCDDPYETADLFVEQLGWQLVFSTPPDSDDKLACVALGDARVMLGTAGTEFLPERSKDHRGAGVQVYVLVDPDRDLHEVLHATQRQVS